MQKGKSHHRLPTKEPLQHPLQEQEQEQEHLYTCPSSEIKATYLNLVQLLKSENQFRLCKDSNMKHINQDQPNCCLLEYSLKSVSLLKRVGKGRESNTRF